MRGMGNGPRQTTTIRARRSALRDPPRSLDRTHNDTRYQVTSAAVQEWQVTANGAARGSSSEAHEHLFHARAGHDPHESLIRMLRLDSL